MADGSNFNPDIIQYRPDVSSGRSHFFERSVDALRSVIKPRSSQEGRSGWETSFSSSLIAAKLQKRIHEGKSADVVIADVDGTVYVRQPTGGIYRGRNYETTQQLQNKSIPLILNTARPIWDPDQDRDITDKVGLPNPDAIIAGTGTMIYWRNTDGSLSIDHEYADRMKQHKIVVNKNGQPTTVPFSIHAVGEAIQPHLLKYVSPKKLVDFLVDQGPQLPDGTRGIDGLRLVFQHTPYEELKQLTRELRENISGIKLQLSEITEQTTSDTFTGWVHVIPSIAGKNKATEYILTKLAGANPGHKINAHVLGDTSVDIPLLTMGSNPDKDGYTVHQYGVQNLPERTRAKLTRVVEALSGERGQSLAKRAHLKLMDSPGPDALFEVVDSLPTLSETVVPHEAPLPTAFHELLRRPKPQRRRGERPPLLGLKPFLEMLPPSFRPLVNPAEIVESDKRDMYMLDMMRELQGRRDGYQFFTTPEERHELVETARRTAEYLHDNKIRNFVIMDRAARPIYIGVKEMWKKLYPNEKLPDIYFLNPTGFMNLNEAEKTGQTGLPKGMEMMYSGFLKGNDLGQGIRSQAEIEYDFMKTFQRMLANRNEPTLLFDTCIHSGDSVGNVQTTLRNLGFANLKLGLVGNEKNDSGMRPDFVAVRGKPLGVCYPFDRDRLTERRFDSVTSAPTEDPLYLGRSRALRAEIHRIFRQQQAPRAARFF